MVTARNRANLIVVLQILQDAASAGAVSEPAANSYSSLHRQLTEKANDMTTPPVHSITEMNRLRDRAYIEAQALRREAMADFWRGADHWVQAMTSTIERSAQLLASRLRRRAGRSTARHCG